MQLRSRHDAIAKGEAHYFTGKPCSRGHVSPRFASNFNCVECGKLHSAGWAEKNPEKRARMVSRWFDKNDGYRGEWRKQNRHRLNEHEGRRRATKLNATPSWLTQAQRAEIDGIYHFASVMSRLSGEPHHVDHVVPLQGRRAKGLHVPWNLRVVTAAENLRKGNRLER
jgi:hypothetical protein